MQKGKEVFLIMVIKKQPISKFDKKELNFVEKIDKLCKEEGYKFMDIGRAKIHDHGDDDYLGLAFMKDERQG